MPPTKDSSVQLTGNLVTPNRPIRIDPEYCSGCNKCVEACMNDVFMPHPERDRPPFVVYPDECWYCGNCVKICPCEEEGAIELVWPMLQRVRWKCKETGEHFRVGMPNPPPPNTKPPV